MRTINGTNVTDNMRGIIYVCEYDYKTNDSTVVDELIFTEVEEAFDVYKKVNPESKLVYGYSSEELKENLNLLHNQICLININ